MAKLKAQIEVSLQTVSNFDFYRFQLRYAQLLKRDKSDQPTDHFNHKGETFNKSRRISINQSKVTSIFRLHN